MPCRSLALVVLAGALHAPAAQAAPVKLYYAKAGYSTGWSPPDVWTFDGRLVGYVEVENLAYAKQVTVVYQTAANGGWNELEASYVRPAAGNHEVWRFVSPRTTGSADYRFAVRYRAAGLEHWDNNGGHDYRVSFGPQPLYPEVVLGKSVVALDRVSLHNAWTGDHAVDIAVKNLAYHKVVQVVYSTDDWQTVQLAQAAYRQTLANGAEIWRALIAVGGYGYSPPVELAIVYKVNGAETWDNNFSEDYDRQDFAP